jgi:hypothetical protein
MAVLIFRDRQDPVVTTLLLLQAPAICLAYSAVSPVRLLRSAARATRYQMAGNVLPLATSCVAPRSSMLPWVAGAFLCSWFVTTTLSVRVCRRFDSPDAVTESVPLFPKADFGLYNLAIAALTLDLPLYALAAGSTKASAVAAVSRWVSPLGSLSNGYTSAAYGAMASADSDLAATKVFRDSKMAVLLLLSAVLSLVAVAPLLVDVTLGDRYAGSSLVLRLLALSALPSALVGSLVTLLQARGHHRLVSRVHVVWAGCYLVLVALFSPLFGAWYLPVMLGISSFIVGMFLVGVVWRLSSSSQGGQAYFGREPKSEI